MQEGPQPQRGPKAQDGCMRKDSRGRCKFMGLMNERVRVVAKLILSLKLHLQSAGLI